MADKITLNAIASGFNLANINANFASISAYINDNVLSRTTVTGDTNQMNNTLDMNSYRIINTSTPSSNTDVANKAYVDGRLTVDTTLTINTIQEAFTATVGQTVFTLTSETYTPGSLNLDVYINGVHQDTTDYTETSTSVITFGTGLEAGDKVLLKINQRTASADSLSPSDVVAALANTTVAPGNIILGDAVSTVRTGTDSGDSILFQAYDVGAGSYTTFATLTADATTPTLDFSADSTFGGQALITWETSNPTAKGGDTDGVFSFVPNLLTTKGGVLQLYGDTHATRADDFALLSDNVEVFDYDASASEFTMVGDLDITGDTAVTGALSATGVVTATGLVLSSGNITLASGAGIDFSATADGTGTTTSEVLDDYEEGTFTPIATTSAGSGTITYGVPVGRYTKIGDMCFISIEMNVTSWDSRTGSIKFGGLPFTVATGDDAWTISASGSAGGGLAIAAGDTVTGNFDAADTSIFLELWDSTTGITSLDVAADCPTGLIILVSGCYRAA